MIANFRAEGSLADANKPFRENRRSGGKARQPAAITLYAKSPLGSLL